MRTWLLVALLSVASAGAQTAQSPEIVGALVGPLATPVQPALHLYGNDLGWTFEHDGQLHMLFGDTWPTADSLCHGEPRNDDTQAVLAPEPVSGVPALTFLARSDAPDEFAPMLVERDGVSIPMAYGQVPLTGFSDGADAHTILGRGEYVRCTRRAPGGRPSCKPHQHLACTQDVGECLPAAFEIPALCDLATGTGCLPGTTCQATEAGFCVDPDTSQNDGTRASLPFTVAHDQEMAVQDTARPGTWISIGRFATNKFANLTARTVRCFSGGSCGSDYTTGHGALLVWGRPGFTGTATRQVQAYLMVHRLPIRRDRHGRMRWRPRFFAGVHPVTGEPLWTGRESGAAPMALDGVVGGSPHEEQPIVSQVAVSWVGAPVNRWVMIYSGDLPDYVLPDPASARPGPSPGAVRIRFAEHPWGPWTPPAPHLLPGSPTVVGDPYGPGGVLFHPLCVDQGSARCAPGDPTRPPDYFIPGCPSFAASFDAGRFYGANIIDAYTRPSDGGADIVWNVSTWNPYGVVLARTHLDATPIPTEPPSCPKAGVAPRSGLGGKVMRFRWCDPG